MVSVWTLTGTFRRQRRVLGVDACLMRFYDPAMQKKSICNLRHLFKNITEFGVWYKYDVFGHFAFVLQMSVMWTHRSRTEDTFRVWNLFTARRQERFLLFFYITDLYVWTPRIFKITFCKTLLWQRSWGLMSEDWNWTWATSAQTWRKNSLFELLVSSRLFLHDLVAVQNQRW